VCVCVYVRACERVRDKALEQTMTNREYDPFHQETSSADRKSTFHAEMWMMFLAVLR